MIPVEELAASVLTMLSAKTICVAIPIAPPHSRAAVMTAAVGVVGPARRTRSVRRVVPVVLLSVPIRSVGLMAVGAHAVTVSPG